jgi:hypothetical protein
LVAGFTNSSDLPVTADAFSAERRGAFDLLMMKLNSSASGLLYATYFGAAKDEYVYGHCIAVDDSGNTYLTGYTLSADFPTTPDAFDTTHDGGFDAFLFKIGPPYSNLVADHDDTAARPQIVWLLQNSPNPFNAATEIRYQLLEETDVSLKIYNVAGQIVRTLVEARPPAGSHAAAWDGTDDNHRAMASGIYFCRIQAGQTTEAIKMTLVR